MSDIFREVEEEVRRDQAKQLWDRYGIYVIGVAVLIVLVTAGYRGWEWYSARQAAQAGAEYYAAMQLARDGQTGQAETAFDEIASRGGGVATLARIRAAAAKAEAGEDQAAVAEFDSIANQSGVQRDLRNVARIRAAYVLLNMNDRAGVEQRVADLASGNSVWRASAREVLGLAAYQDGDMEAASQRFEELLGDNETPSDMRARAQLMISLIAADRPSMDIDARAATGEGADTEASGSGAAAETGAAEGAAADTQ